MRASGKGNLLVAFVADPLQAWGVVVHSHLERLVLYIVYVPLRNSGIFVFGECVGIFLTQGVLHILFAVDVAGAPLGVIQGPHIVQSSGVVLMIVGEEYGIQMGDTFS